MNIIINIDIEDIRNIEAGNGIGRIDYAHAYDGYDYVYEAEKNLTGKIMIV